MKKAALVLLILITLLCCTAALADPATPQNPHWKEGSTATAAWDAVDGAD